ncbi:MAG TPA: DUF6644 family protein [Bryobacteraceae bacterium]|nr:DUF6644 family protein [Bryobacteraceae bacterium]
MQIAHAIQSTELGTAIRESALVFPVILTTHLACIAVFGGMILVTNLRLLGLAFKDRAVADMVDGLRNWKRLGFCIMVTMGALLAGSEAEKYSINPFFWCKMVTLALIGIHGLAFRRSVYSKASEFDRTGVIPVRAKLAAALSLLLWMGMVTFGRLIGYYEPAQKTQSVIQTTAANHKS